MPEVPLSSSHKTYRLIGGGREQVQKLTQGYARTKRWTNRTKYCKQQLAFLMWAFNVGAKDLSKKLTPERAAEIMAFVGTEEGHKKFPNDSCMDVSTNGKPIFKYSDLV